MVLNRIDLRGVSNFEHLLPRPKPVSEDVVATVRQIVAAVAAEGDSALLGYTKQLDGVGLRTPQVSSGALDAALSRLAPELREALEAAAVSIAEFHAQQVTMEHISERNGITVRSWDQPVSRVGCYVPGGRAAYPSTVLMTALPAQAAGVKQIALCVPPSATGHIADVTLAAAAIAGVDEVYSVGGAQAIAAMAYGTESIVPVDVIVGPGNMYVAIAKQLVASQVSVPAAFAGPSEIVVVADSSAPATYVAVDLMVQAEHGPDGLAWLITFNSDTAKSIEAAVSKLLVDAARQDDIRSTFASSGQIVLVDNAQAAAAVVDLIAPEHLQVMTANPRDVIDHVHNAGAIFSGPFSAASVGDYIAGPSHVLPTNASARFAGVLSVRDFVKPMHEVTVSEKGLAHCGNQVATIAAAEGLQAHAQSIRLRLTDIAAATTQC